MGAWSGIPGLYSSDGAPRDLILGTASNRKIFLGTGTGDAYFTAGKGSLWTKGSVEAHDNMYVYSENNRLRMGSIWGLPGIYSSDGAPRDLMIGTEQNKKIFFGYHRNDAWIEAGSGAAFFKGLVTVTNNVKLETNGVSLTVGDIKGNPGITGAADGVARDLVLDTGNGKKVYLGNGREDASIEAGTGNAYFKGEMSSKNVKTTDLQATGKVVFDDTVTVKKNLILLSQSGSQLDLLQEVASLREQNEELMRSFEEMRATMQAMMDAK